MKKNLLTILVVFISLSAISQTEATTKDGVKVILNNNGTWMYADCAPLLKTEQRGEEMKTSAKEPIVITKDNGLSGLDIIMFKGSDAVIINFHTLGKDIYCINKNAPALFTFSDGTTLTLKHSSKLNCKGDFALFLGEKLGTGNELNALRTKKIRKIAIEYTDSNNGNVSTYTKETIIPEAEGDKIMKTIHCLSNL